MLLPLTKRLRVRPPAHHEDEHDDAVALTCRSFVPSSLHAAISKEELSNRRQRNRNRLAEETILPELIRTLTSDKMCTPWGSSDVRHCVRVAAALAAVLAITLLCADSGISGGEARYEEVEVGLWGCYHLSTIGITIVLCMERTLGSVLLKIRLRLWGSLLGCLFGLLCVVLAEASGSAVYGDLAVGVGPVVFAAVCRILQERSGQLSYSFSVAAFTAVLIAWDEFVPHGYRANTHAVVRAANRCIAVFIGVVVSTAASLLLPVYAAELLPVQLGGVLTQVRSLLHTSLVLEGAGLTEPQQEQLQARAVKLALEVQSPSTNIGAAAFEWYVTSPHSPPVARFKLIHKELVRAYLSSVDAMEACLDSFAAVLQSRAVGTTARLLFDSLDAIHSLLLRSTSRRAIKEDFALAARVSEAAVGADGVGRRGGCSRAEQPPYPPRAAAPGARAQPPQNSQSEAADEEIGIAVSPAAPTGLAPAFEDILDRAVEGLAIASVAVVALSSWAHEHLEYTSEEGIQAAQRKRHCGNALLHNFLLIHDVGDASSTAENGGTPPEPLGADATEAASTEACKRISGLDGEDERHVHSALRISGALGRLLAALRYLAVASLWDEATHTSHCKMFDQLFDAAFDDKFRDAICLEPLPARDPSAACEASRKSGHALIAAARSSSGCLLAMEGMLLTRSTAERASQGTESAWSTLRTRTSSAVARAFAKQREVENVDEARTEKLMDAAFPVSLAPD